MSELTWYVGGTARSGSTLFSGLLSEATDGSNVGELHILWRSFTLGRTCTCTRSLTECPIWSVVADRVLRRMGISSTSGAAEIEAKEPSQRRVVMSGARVRLASDVLRLRAATEAAIRETTGRPIIVDSSKVAGTLSVAMRASPLVRSVHLVRDPRAVVYSMANPKPDPSLHGRMLPTSRPLRTSLTWVATNLAHERLLDAGSFPGTRVLYEDFVVSPVDTIRRVVGSDCRLDLKSLSSSGEHAIAGNPWRFEGTRALALDRRWQGALARADRRLTTIVTIPGLLRYGYPIVGSRMIGR